MQHALPQVWKRRSNHRTFCFVRMIRADVFEHTAFGDEHDTPHRQVNYTRYLTQHGRDWQLLWTIKYFTQRVKDNDITTSANEKLLCCIPWTVSLNYVVAQIIRALMIDVWRRCRLLAKCMWRTQNWCLCQVLGSGLLLPPSLRPSIACRSGWYMTEELGDWKQFCSILCMLFWRRVDRF